MRSRLWALLCPTLVVIGTLHNMPFGNLCKSRSRAAAVKPLILSESDRGVKLGKISHGLALDCIKLH